MIVGVFYTGTCGCTDWELPSKKHVYSCKQAACCIKIFARAILPQAPAEQTCLTPARPPVWVLASDPTTHNTPPWPRRGVTPSSLEYQHHSFGCPDLSGSVTSLRRKHNLVVLTWTQCSSWTVPKTALDMAAGSCRSPAALSRRVSSRRQHPITSSLTFLSLIPSQRVSALRDLV